jgi:hypothetical protein
MRAMEGAAVLRKSVKQSCVENPSVPKDQDPQLVFGPVQLQRELKLRQITIRDKKNKGIGSRETRDCFPWVLSRVVIGSDS